MSTIKGIVQLVILVLISATLLWLALRTITVEEGESRLDFVISVWNTSNKRFLMLSGGLALFSHFVRAERWKLQLEPVGHTITTAHSFLSVMIGYFINLAIPRGGELSRCYNLYKLNGTPIDLSFGTVVAERVVDLVILLSLISVAFFIEFDNLILFFNQLQIPFDLSSMALGSKLLILAGVIVFGFGVYLLVMRLFRAKTLRLLVKFRRVYKGLKTGLLSIFRMKKRGLFIIYSITIWVLYYLMSYSIVLAFPETNELGLLDTLTIFVIGGIAMAIPLPGGTGSYHVLVPLGMVLLFGIGQEESVAFSFIFHGWQTIIVIVVGLVSMIISQYLIRLKKNAIVQ